MAEVLSVLGHRVAMICAISCAFCEIQVMMQSVVVVQAILLLWAPVSGVV